MNLILLENSDYINQRTVEFSDDRYKYIKKIHKAVEGDILKVGRINGHIGTGKILKFDDKSVVLDILLDKVPPEPLPVNLVLALPRPKVLRRIIQSVTTLGIKKIYIINAFRVEKSYWQTPFLKEEKIEEQIKLGLSQAVDTIKPEILLRKGFKPFLEDELSDISEGTYKIVAHPSGDEIIKRDSKKSTLVIGPEGGFIQYELDKLKDKGFNLTKMGSRILKVETAVPFIISKISG